MRKIFLLFSVIGIGAMGASFAACSSSSSGDDSTTPTDSGTDTSVTGDTGSPVDSGSDTSTAACATCSQLLAQGFAAGTPCTASLPIVSAILSCACTSNALAGPPYLGLCQGNQVDGGDAGDNSCSDFCGSPTTVVPSSACSSCAADNCPTEIAACIADGSDAGAGDGGDGG